MQRPDDFGRDGLHDRLVPVAARYLRQLDGILAHSAAHAVEIGMSEEALLDARLGPDMLALRMQAQIAMEFPFRALDQVLVAPPSRQAVETDTIARLRGSIRERIGILERTTRQDWRDPDSLVLRDKAGEADIEATAASFISMYVLPNFFFHTTAAYLTCRLLGVPLGKGDFDGFHLYGTSATKT